MPILKSKRENIILSIAFGLIIFALAFNKLISPVLDKNSQLNKEIYSSRVKLERYSRLISQGEYIREKYSLFSSGSGAQISSGGTQMGAFSQLESLAVAAGIRIIDIRPQAGRMRGIYQESTVDIKTEGQMEGYLKLIYDIESLPATFKIKKIQLNARPGAQALGGSMSLILLSQVD